MNWRIANLGEIIRLRKQFISIDDTAQYKRCRVQLHAQGIVLRDIIMGIAIKTKEQQICHAGEFLVAEIDAKVGGFGIVPHELDGAIVSSHYFLFMIDGQQLEPSFLNYFIRTPAFRDQVNAQGSTNYAAIRPSHVIGYTIPLPPLSKQRRIVAKVEELAAKIEEARRIHRRASQEVDAFIGSEVCRIFTDGLAEGWTTGVLGDYVDDTCYGTSEKTNSDGLGTPILRMGNIQNGQLDIRSLAYLQLSKAEHHKLLLDPGDIVVNRTNSAELVGKCAVFNLDREYGFASYLIRVRLHRSKADPWLVATYINSPIGREYMFRERKQMTGQANVNAQKLKALPIALPPLSEQCRIVAYLDDLQAKVDSLKALQAQSAAELDALLPSILDKAFKGEL